MSNIFGLQPNRYEALVKLLDEIAKSENVQNHTIDIKAGCEKGDGYAGEKHIATLRGSNKTLSLFVKAAPTDEGFRRAFDPRGVFLIEIAFYDEAYPALIKFQEVKKIANPFQSVIGCLRTSTELNNEMMILQNARDLGYTLWDRRISMNQAHAEFIMKEYGKYHAISYAMKDQEPKEYRKVVDSLNQFDLLKLLIDVMGNAFVTLSEKALVNFDPVKEPKVFAAFKDIADNVLKKYLEAFTHQDKYSVITHGDCWCNNMMFKYSKEDKEHFEPIAMCLLDFQMAREASPVCDLSYFFYASCSKDVYNNLDHYLKIYHDTLSQNLRDLGSDPEEMLPFAELKKQWKKCAKFGLVMAMMLLKVVLVEKEDILDISEVMAISNNPMDSFVKDQKTDHIYHANFKELVYHFYDSGFI